MNSIPINKKDRENLSFFQDLYNVKIPDIGNITIKDRKKISSNIKKYNFTLFELNDVLIQTYLNSPTILD